MNLEADINWIQKEIGKIKDPDLINVFKSILQYREKKAADDTLDLLLEKAIADRENERTKPHDEVRRKYDKWL